MTTPVPVPLAISSIIMSEKLYNVAFKCCIEMEVVGVHDMQAYHFQKDKVKLISVS